MTKQFKAMKAADYDAAKQRFPVLASPKIDGFRATIVGTCALAYSQKPFPNPWVQELFGRRELAGFDGEFTVGPANAKNVVQRTAEVMRKTGEPDVYFHVFDDFSDPSLPTNERQDRLMARLALLEEMYGDTEWFQRISLVTQTIIEDADELDEYETRALKSGYEGVMLRDPDKPYKFGRSTAKEGTLVKVKRFADAEAVIVGFSPAMHNTNQAVKNALGRTERSSAKDGLVPMDMIGTIHVMDWKGDDPFSFNTRGFDIAPGTMDHNTRKALWIIRYSLIGKTVTYKYLPHGEKDVPRHGSFLRFRDSLDMA